MKFSLGRRAVCSMAVVVILGWQMPAFAGDDGDLLKQAEVLVKQAWNPGGDPPSKDDRTQWLTKAAQLAHDEPDHRLGGKRVEAVRLIKLAEDDINAGASESKISGDLEDADRLLRTAIEGAEGH